MDKDISNALRNSIMGQAVNELKYSILIIDDNPFPTKEMIKVLLPKFCNYFNITIEYECFQESEKVYEKSEENFVEIRGKVFEFDLCSMINITLYNYNASISPEENQKLIIDIVINRKINIFWTDRGHSLFRISNEKLYGTETEYKTNSDELFKNQNLIKALLGNNGKNILQIAVYSYNPSLTQQKINEGINFIISKLIDSYSIEENEQKGDEILKIKEDFKKRIHFIETSPILNLYDQEYILTAGIESDNYLGHLSAYKEYGKLLGHTLFDLFLQLPENKNKLSDEARRYNFFNSLNRKYVRYIKLLNDKFLPEDTFRIGLVSFYCEVFGEDNFLLDVPYKNYYSIYDRLLKDHDIISIFKTDNITDKKDCEKYIYYKYAFDQIKSIYNFNFTHDLSVNEEKIKKFLPLLHTGIFYEPNFYELKDFPFNKFQSTNNEILNTDSCCEIFYLFKNTDFNGIPGILHFALYRRSLTLDVDVLKNVETFWQSYCEIIEAKAAETLIPLLLKQIISNASRAAISQVMARNMSHNHGSHVLSKLTTSRDFENISFSKYIPIPRFVRRNIDGIVELTKDELLANFMLYQKQRMDFLADIATSTPTLENTKFLLKDIMSGLDSNRILLEHISGTDIKYSFTIKDCRNCTLVDIDSRNGCDQSCSIISDSNTGTSDILVSVPNDVLGQHAFYVIVENIIRNTAKHGNISSEGNVKFTIEVHECKKDKSLYEFVIYDDCKIIDKKSIDISDTDVKNKYDKLIKEKDLEISINIIEPNYIDALVYDQNYRLNQSILDPLTNQLRHGAWGLVEMDVSAAYLRKIDIAEVNDDKYSVPLTTTDEEEYSVNGYKIPTLQSVNKNNCLAYRFYMNKPKEILILDENGNWWKDNFGNDLDKLEHFRSQGILVLHNSDNQIANYKFDEKEIYPHHILFTIDDGIEYSKNTNLPGRIISIELFNSSLKEGNNPILRYSENDFKFEEFIIPLNINAFKEQCWRCWVLKLMNLQKVDGFHDLMPRKITKPGKWGAILFDDHGQTLDETTFPNDDKTETVLSSLYKYVEVYNHHSKSWYEEAKTGTNRIEYFKLIEGILSPVIIIDERVQAFSETLYKPQSANWGKKFFYLFNKSGVIIPGSDVNLNEATFTDAYRKNLVNLLTTEYQGLKYNLYLVIHLGVIEKILKAEGKEKGKDEILKFVEDLGCDKPNMKIIITSGRGKSDNLPSEVPFLSFSIVSQFTIENSRFKAFLVQALQAARPLKNSN